LGLVGREYHRLPDSIDASLEVVIESLKKTSLRKI